MSETKPTIPGFEGDLIVKTPSPTVPGAVIRRFADADIAAAVDKALATVPIDRNGAVVLVADLKGIRAVAAAKIDQNWSIAVVGEYEYGRRLNAEAVVRFAW